MHVRWKVDLQLLVCCPDLNSLLLDSLYQVLGIGLGIRLVRRALVALVEVVWHITVVAV